MKKILTILFTIFTLAGFSQSITVTVGEKVASSLNSDSLGGKAPAFFVDTATVQNIRGVKSFINRINLTDGLQFIPATGFSHSEGLLFYDSNTKTFSGFIDRTDVTLNIGEENWLRVVNKSGGDFTDGQVVYIDSAQGNRPTILLAKADALLTSQGTIAVLTEDIDNNEEGIATTFGLVRGFNTTGFDPGDELFLSATTEGGIVNTKPTAPNFVIRIGWALNSMSNGSILVNISVYGDGTNNTFIDQDVTSGSSPTFDGTNFTAIAVDTITGDIATTQVAGFQDSVTANTNVTANTVHRTSDGSDHTFINQDVTSTGSPTFDNLIADSINVDSINIQSQLSFDNGATITNTETDTLFLTETVIRLDGEIILNNYIRHHDITAGAATSGPTAPSSVSVGTYRGLSFDTDSKSVNFAMEVPNDWDGISDMALVVHWHSADGDIIANGETVKFDISYRSTSEGEAVDNGTVVAITATFTGGASEIDKQHYETSITIDFDNVNQPLSIDDDLGFQFDRDVSGDTYSGAAIVYKWDLVYTANKTPRGD